MKVKALLATAAISLSIAGTANGMNGFANCASTEMVEFDGTVVDAALATPELSTLVDAVTAAGLVDALATTEDITVFAPTNDAFAALPQPLLDAVLADTDLLTSVLTYHVVPTPVDSRRFFTPARRPTLQGQTVYFAWYRGESRVNNAALHCQGVSTSNGDVYVIDSVLLPNM